jgi:hypothetical protein
MINMWNWTYTRISLKWIHSLEMMLFIQLFLRSRNESTRDLFNPKVLISHKCRVWCEEIIEGYIAYEWQAWAINREEIQRICHHNIIRLRNTRRTFNSRAIPRHSHCVLNSFKAILCVHVSESDEIYFPGNKHKWLRRRKFLLSKFIPELIKLGWKEEGKKR